MSGSSLHGKRRVDGGSPRRVDLRLDGERLHGRLDDAHVEATARRVGEADVLVELDGRRVRAVVARQGDRWLVSIGGAAFDVARADGAEAVEGGGAAEPFAASPMTGVVTRVHVVAGAAVAKGAPLFAVEAMKMEYVVRADRDVTVAEIRCKAGDRVGLGDVVVAFG